MHLKYKVEITNDDTGEIIYVSEFSTQEIMEEHLREMANEVAFYDVGQQEEATKHIEPRPDDYPENEEEDAGHIEDRF